MTYASCGKGGIVDDLACIVKGCGRCASLRGLCRSHYWNLARLVGKGQMTWAQLEEEGKILPRKPRKTRQN